MMRWRRTKADDGRERYRGTMKNGLVCVVSEYSDRIAWYVFGKGGNGEIASGTATSIQGAKILARSAALRHGK